MPKITGSAFDTLSGLVVRALWTQETPIAASHQGQPLFHEADNPTAQVTRLPAPRRNTAFAEKAFGDRAVALAFDMTIQRPQHEREAPTPLWG